MRYGAPRMGRPRRHKTFVKSRAVESKPGVVGRLENSLSIASGAGEKSRVPSQKLPPTAIYCHFGAANRDARYSRLIRSLPLEGMPARLSLVIDSRSLFFTEARVAREREGSETFQKPAICCHLLPFVAAKPLRPFQPFHFLFAVHGHAGQLGPRTRTARGAKRSLGGMLPSDAVCHMTRESTSTDECIRDSGRGRHLINPGQNSERAERTQIPSANPPSTECGCATDSGDQGRCSWPLRGRRFLKGRGHRPPAAVFASECQHPLAHPRMPGRSQTADATAMCDRPAVCLRDRIQEVGSTQDAIGSRQ